MTDPSSNPGQQAALGKAGSCPLTVVELTVVLEELDRVVAELEESLTELALPFDEDSRFKAYEAARRGR